MTAARADRFTVLAWAAALLPFAAANLAYLVSASAELVPWCFPYVDGCASVSRAARHGDAVWVFKGLMFPTAAVTAAYWWLAADWLESRAVRGLGLTGAAFMALYVVFLGADGEAYQWLRRYGITVHYAATVLALLLVMAALVRDSRVPAGMRRLVLGHGVVLLLLGLASIPLRNFAEDRDAAVNALEWSYTLLIVAFYPLSAQVRNSARSMVPPLR